MRRSGGSLPSGDQHTAMSEVGKPALWGVARSPERWDLAFPSTRSHILTDLHGPFPTPKQETPLPAIAPTSHSSLIPLVKPAPVSPAAVPTPDDTSVVGFEADVGPGSMGMIAVVESASRMRTSGMDAGRFRGLGSRSGLLILAVSTGGFSWVSLPLLSPLLIRRYSSCFARSFASPPSHHRLMCPLAL
jgi:hypothetical protein